MTQWTQRRQHGKAYDMTEAVYCPHRSGVKGAVSGHKSQPVGGEQEGPGGAAFTEVQGIIQKDSYWQFCLIGEFKASRQGYLESCCCQGSQVYIPVQSMWGGVSGASPAGHPS